jgi:hypothetical protein
MKKNYFLSFWNSSSCNYCNKRKVISIFYIAILGLLLVPNLSTAQSTVLLSPTVNNGGFESGATGWTITNGGFTNRNQWTVNTGAGSASGTNAAYVTSNTGTGSIYQYANSAAIRVTHLSRSVTIPAGQSLIRLSFQWKATGITGTDRLRVFAVPTTYVPAYGVAIDGVPSGGCACAYTQLGLTEYINQTSWGPSGTITIPATYAGTTFTLVFEWEDSGAVGSNPNQPAAIDNINLICYNPVSDDCANAIPLNVSTACVNETYTNVGSTDSAVSMSPSPPTPSCGVYNGTDVWYTAVVGGDGTLTLTVSSSGGLTDPMMTAYSGTCGGLTQITCADDTVGLFPVIALTGRTPGEVIYVRVNDWGATQDYGTFNICATSPSCYTPTVNAATSITTTTATINWTANPGGPPSGGYQYVVSTSNTTPVAAGTTAAGNSANIIGLTQNTVYYVFVRGFCGGSDYSAWSASGTFTTIIPAPTTTGASFCAGGSGTITATALCSTLNNIGNNFSGTLSASDPTAPRMTTLTVSTDPCSFPGGATNYTSQTFQVSVTGSYVFTMDNNTGFDAMAYITSGTFVPGSCGSGSFIAGDDDTAGLLEPQVSANLTVGVLYTIYTQAFTNGGNGPFSYTVGGPGNLLTTTAGQLQWWTAASGGTLIGTGTPFNPVGVAGSGVANNTTPISTNFYAACSSFPSIRTGASFVILASPSSVISGTGSACTSTTVSIALSGASPWTFTYTDGTTPVTITNTSTTPYTFSASPGTPTTYTVSALSNAACATTTAAYRTGSAVLYSKVWNGGTANWSTAGNWTPSGVPTNTDCVVIANAGIPPVISGTNYYAYASKLTVNNSATLTVNATNSLTVTDGITVASTIPVGNIVLNDDSSLVQITDVASNNNLGNITFNRTATMQRTDYVYWSSPFVSLNASLISPTTNPYYIWKWNPSIANANGGQGNWVNGNDSPMIVGKGYIIRAPDTHPLTPTDFTTTLTGRPNNGIITSAVTRGTIFAPFTGGNGVTILATDDNWNLVGNPYPSSIDAVKFLTDNNANLADLNVRLWTHNSPVGSASSSFYNSYTYGYADSYTTYNISGPNPPGFGGKIASGQAFFISANEASPTVVFNNTMRQFDYDNSQFFRNSDHNINLTNLDRSRIWLSILNEVNANATTMVCYVNEATMDKDRLFDAPTNDIGILGIYSLINDEKMVIQGRSAFNVSDIVPIGYTSAQNGIYKIAIAAVDGVFENTETGIYLEDTLLGIMHDLRANYYTFTTNAGTFDTRFKIHYTNTALGNSDLDEVNTLSYINNNVLNIKSTKNIEQVDIYDITGKLIKSCKVANVSQNFETDFNYPNGVYLLKIKLDNGVQVTKKQIK